MLPIRDPRKALCMGGIFAVSTVLPEKIQHLAYHLETIKQFGADGVLEHSLQVLGCFLVLSVLTGQARANPIPSDHCWRTHPTTGTPCWSMSLAWWSALC